MTRYNEAMHTIKLAMENGIEASLEGFTELMHFLGDPQENYPCVQIAGTNGKTSTSRYTAAILQACGMKTGLYTSPELMFYPERMEVDGQVSSDDMFSEIILSTWDLIQEAIQAGVIDFCTEFEVLTASGFRLFAQEKVDWGVLEVGLGGLWDATSVVTPKVAVVTGIDLEHTHILGDTVEEIAVQKAAIIKSGSFAVLGPGTEETRQVFLDRCAEVGADYHIIEPPYADLKYIGANYQIINISTAWVAAEHALGHAIPIETVQQALDGMIVPGRFETLRSDPLLMIDATHNPQAAQYLESALLDRFTLEADDQGNKRIVELDTLVLCILNDKDTTGIINTLTPYFRNLAVTQSTSSRAIPYDELAELVRKNDGRSPRIYKDIDEALEDIDKRGETAMVTGSITLAGEAKASFLGK
ncbi:MAG: Mur ligase family protein [Coriobacteriia bacterium]|nr:Mur ligase family protein [Coriobacteriia bacterium]